MMQALLCKASHAWTGRAQSAPLRPFQTQGPPQLSSIKADSTRLVCVAERLVDLGAEGSAEHVEGRTAHHLAAGCVDEAMVLKLVQVGTNINCRDSDGGDCVVASVEA